MIQWSFLVGFLCASILAVGEVSMAQSFLFSDSKPVVPSAKAKLKVGLNYFVDADTIKVRLAPVKEEEAIGRLHRNDLVSIVSLLDDANPFVEVKVVSGRGVSLNAYDRLYVSAEYLSAKNSQNNISTQYFVVQNVATEVTRVYEKCTKYAGCPHRLVFESDMVVGRRKNSLFSPEEWYTHLGVNKIQYWDKFHEDGEGHYPAWYSKDYPPVPPPGSDFSDWFDSDVMPNKNGQMRGAFGWFAAILGPKANYQWIHGTAGWGSDGPKFIDVTRNLFLSSINDARSSGCTRLENGAVAFLRHIIAAGTPIIRVYAREAVWQPSLYSYKSQKQRVPFFYILTKSSPINDSRAATIERQAVLDRGVPASEWLEEGVYNIDQYPTVRKYRFSPGFIGAGTGALGNIYRIYGSEFNGHFLVDTGRFYKYAHPKSLPASGMSGVIVPDYTVAPLNTPPLEPIDYED
ncbi:MAG: hypothetical protein RJB66_250 [Pseudomonadota bacterium]|jgi:hypothetical protein